MTIERQNGTVDRMTTINCDTFRNPDCKARVEIAYKDSGREQPILYPDCQVRLDAANREAEEWRAARRKERGEE